MHAKISDGNAGTPKSELESLGLRQVEKQGFSSFFAKFWSYLMIFQNSLVKYGQHLATIEEKKTLFN